jgi:hypothetical protein
MTAPAQTPVWLLQPELAVLPAAAAVHLAAVT